MRYAIGYLDVLTPPAFDDGNNNTDGSSSSRNNNSNSAGIIVVSEGANASLSCQASGHPAPEISWRREDNEPIRLSNQEEAPKVEGSALVLAQVSRLNTGAYLCIASNGVQPSASRRQVLDVQYKPVIRLPQTEVEARLGQQEAQLICYVDLNPAGSHHWAKVDVADASRAAAPSLEDDDDQALIDHYELINSDKHEIVMKQVNSETVQMVLTVRRIERSDLARYKCIARNSLGIQSNFVRLAEPAAGFSLNNMFGGRASGPTSPDQPPSDQQLSDQQQQQQPLPARPGGMSPPRTSQYLSTRANSRSSWIQRSPSPSSSSSRVSPSGASSAGFSWSSRPLFVSSLALGSLLVVCHTIAQIVVVVVFVDGTLSAASRGRLQNTQALAIR